MIDKKGWGSTVLGWFIVQDDRQAGQRNGEVAAGDEISDPTQLATSIGTSGDYEASAVTSTEASAPAPDAFQHGVPAAPGGKVDFEAVFESAGVDAEERGRVARAVELIRSLPAGTDMTVKKQIVEASLKAFGVPIEKIIEAGAEEIQALEFYIRAGASDTEKLINESDQRIKAYEEEIRNIRQIMQERVAEQQAVVTACNSKKLEIQEILEFFGQEKVAAVVKASPKLHDPSAPEEASAK